MTTLAERNARWEKRRTKIEAEEMDRREKQRKRRDKMLIKAGEMVERVGLLELSPEARYGALLSLETGAVDEKTVKRWENTGNEALAKETADRDKDREVIVIRFPEAVTGLEAAALKQAGFRFNRLFGHWEGLAVPEEAQALARAHDGRIILGDRHEPEDVGRAEAAE
jgi:hypothetical protein